MEPRFLNLLLHFPHLPHLQPSYRSHSSFPLEITKINSELENWYSSSPCLTLFFFSVVTMHNTPLTYLFLKTAKAKEKGRKK